MSKMNNTDKDRGEIATEIINKVNSAQTFLEEPKKIKKENIKECNPEEFKEILNKSSINIDKKVRGLFEDVASLGVATGIGALACLGGGFSAVELWTMAEGFDRLQFTLGFFNYAVAGLGLMGVALCAGGIIQDGVNIVSQKVLKGKINKLQKLNEDDLKEFEEDESNKAKSEKNNRELLSIIFSKDPGEAQHEKNDDGKEV